MVDFSYEVTSDNYAVDTGSLEMSLGDYINIATGGSAYARYGIVGTDEPTVYYNGTLISKDEFNTKFGMTYSKATYDKDGSYSISRLYGTPKLPGIYTMTKGSYVYNTRYQTWVKQKGVVLQIIVSSSDNIFVRASDNVWNKGKLYVKTEVGWKESGGVYVKTDTEWKQNS